MEINSMILDKLMLEADALKSIRNNNVLFTQEIKNRLDQLKKNAVYKDFIVVRDIEFLMFSNETYNNHIDEILKIIGTMQNV